MKVWLLYPDREWESRSPYAKKEDIIKDLNFHIIFKMMSREDEYFYPVASQVMMKPLLTRRDIEYRQEMMKDATKNSETFMEIYSIATSAMKTIEKYNETYDRRKGDLNSGAMVTELLNFVSFLVKQLNKLAYIIDETKGEYTSEAMKSFCERFADEYGNEKMKKIVNEMYHLDYWTAGGKLTISGNCGCGMKIDKLEVNKIHRNKRRKAARPLNVLEKVNIMLKSNTFALELEEEKEDARQLEKIAIGHILKVYDGFIKELKIFFEQLRFQMAFYASCASFYKRLDKIGLMMSVPTFATEGNGTFIGLYELTYAIYIQKAPVVNGLRMTDKRLLFVTGANQGGKSTFLRSIGVAQVLFQAGMLVPAEIFSGKIYDNIFTHFTRREDSAMNSGRLEEELKRMRGIIDLVTPNSLILLNESFASTTEKEGTIIMSGVVKALSEYGCSMYIVTHLYELARQIFAENLPYVQFLSAERRNDGKRTYKMVPRQPGYTSYGLDLYEEVLGKITDVITPEEYEAVNVND
ncbi:MAG: hypothetical protein IJW18_04560 [Lachnospiraceae bacterium]|nr:hypothetical protein [Lachnospiraceae bacterium]